MQNYYDILGVSDQASDKEIKDAYRKLAMKYHPDRNPDNKEYEAKFKEINEAYDTLKDSGKKQQYDASRRFGGHNPFEFSFRTGTGSVNEMFEEMFAQHRRRTAKNENIQIVYTISMRDSYVGKRENLKYKLPDGTIKEIELNIPSGVDNGTKIRFNGMGSVQHSHLPPGDLIVVITIADNNREFKRKGNDLVTEISVDAIDAILGTSVEVKNIDGSKISLSIPAGTNPNTVLSCKDLGFPNVDKRFNTRGNLLVVVNIKISKPENDEIRNLYAKLKDELNKIRA